MPLTIAFRVDGNQYIGLGHVYRCLYLSELLKKRGIDSHFFMLQSSFLPQVQRIMAERGVPLHCVSLENDPWKDSPEFFMQCLEKRKYDAVVFDLLIPDPGDDDLNRSNQYRSADVFRYLNLIKSVRVPVIVFSDQFDRMNFDVDLVINTCPVQKREWYSRETSVRYLLGPDYYILPDSFRKYMSIEKPVGESNKVAVFCGGNDHRGYTSVVVDVLQGLALKLDIEVMIGAATPNGSVVAESYRNRGIKVHYAVPDVASVLFDKDFVVTTAGNTLFDLAALGVPAIAIPTRERQAFTSRFFQEAGTCVDIGFPCDELEDRIRNVVLGLLGDPSRSYLVDMRKKGRLLVDGHGGERIAGVIMELIG